MIKQRHYKKTSLILMWIIIFQVISPTLTMALTSGPSQPEVQSFEPVGTSDMVNLFSGDFNYNIPLLEVGGYPVNLAYHAGIGMEQEASWVGLGWNLNPGTVNRNMRGIPDDFSGETIRKEVHRKPNITTSFMLKPGVEFVGIDKVRKAKPGQSGKLKISGKLGIKSNNYKGLSLVLGANMGLDIVKMGSFRLGANLGADTESGITLAPSLSTSMQLKKKEFELSGSLNIGAQLNSRQGLSELTFTKNLQVKTFKEVKIKGVMESYRTGTYGLANAGVLANFNTPSYTPAMDHNSESFSLSANFALGAEVPFANIEGEVSGSYSKHQINGTRNIDAYGYLNHHLADPVSDLMDVNRAFDGPYYDGAKILPITNLTSDVFGITGQGMGGSFKGYRNQINYVTDPNTFMTSDGTSLGAEVGIIASPSTFKGGGNVATYFSNARSGLWSAGNSAISKYNSNALPEDDVDNALFERTYLKQVGELTNDRGRYDNFGGKEPLSFGINRHNLSQNLVTKDNNVVQEKEDKRAIRNQLTSYKTFREAISENQLRTVKYYDAGLSSDGKAEFSEVSLNRYLDMLGVQETQIFEYDVVRADGMRYVYGQPAYNLSKEEVSFNSGQHVPDENGLVTYNPNDAEPGGNMHGEDDYVSRENLPAYSYSHLITKVLSPDYSDLTGDGPSDDDYGSWVKFNYTCQRGPLQGNAYRWRFPYDVVEGTQGIANFNEGFKSTDRDDQANYIYGEKELWFLHSIESKTHIAVFYTSDRADAKGVNNNLGNTSGLASRFAGNQKLDKIKHFAKQDLQEKGADAIPLKTVHFDYADANGNEYTLCKGVPNNFNSDSENNGKLTLRSVYFTYGSSLKGQYSKYKFEYDDNPNYDRKSQDRWGNYQPEPEGVDYNPMEIKDPNDPLSNSDFPYVDQSGDNADNAAKAWNLSNILLPSGGNISVAYEADDYAYVQDKRAGQMFKIVGFSNEEPTSIESLTPKFGDHNQPALLGFDFNNYMVFELDKIPYSRENFYDSYLSGINMIYFRALINLKKDKHEFVPGYTSYEDYGYLNIGSNSYGWVKMKGVGFDKNKSKGDVNPIAKAGWQFTRLHMPELLFPNSDFETNAFERLIRSLAGIFTQEIPRMIKGFNKSIFNEGYASSLVPEKSWIRLNNANFSKKGGGCRVKQIAMNDNWSNIRAGGADPALDASYGQQYFYQKVMNENTPEPYLISSGVASYEPLLGGDENSLKEPIFTNESRALAPDNEYYVERPIGETFYPLGTVGYAQVVVADLRPFNNSLKTASGFVVNEFYTSKDFPYETKMDRGQFYKDEPNIISKLLKFRVKDYMTASQGYSIILNDMHGKPKANWVYSGALPLENGELSLGTDALDGNKISGQEYFYKVDNKNELDNKVKVITPAGEIDEATIGIESEIAVDFRENESRTRRVEIQGNVDTWIIPSPIPIPLIIPTILPNLSDERTRFRSAVVTKVIGQHGLLEKIRVYDQGSAIQTQNLLYDEQTGEVLLTSLNNEFKDKVEDTNEETSEENLIYNLKYPAHWAYEGMQHAYQNIGLEKAITLDPSGLITIPNADKLYFPGDEVIATGRTQSVSVNLLGFDFLVSGIDLDASKKLWVSEVNPPSNQTPASIQLIDAAGVIMTSNYLLYQEFPVSPDWKIKVVRSGHRNQQSLPIANMVTLKNPAEQIMDNNISGGEAIISGDHTLAEQAEALELLDFSAQEFDDEWMGYCGGRLSGEFVDNPTKIEVCLNSADIVFVIGVSDVQRDPQAPVDYEPHFLAMKEDIIETIEELEKIENGDFRYALVTPGPSIANNRTPIPFTSNATSFIEQIMDVQSTIYYFGLQEVMWGLRNQSSALGLRSDVPFNLVVYSNLYAEEMVGGVADDCYYSNQLKDENNAVISMIRYPNSWDIVPLQQNASYSIAASIASDGWNYSGEVSNICGVQNEDSSKRFVPRSIAANLPSIARAINCYETIVNNYETFPLVCGVPGGRGGAVVNPYINGMKGNWRPTKTYVHNHVNRVQQDVNSDLAETDIANKGYFELFDQFWNKPSDGGTWYPDTDNYINTTETTIYSPYGEALESKDALGIYAAAILGYDKKLPTAVGSNMKYVQLGYDGFEEAEFYSELDCPPPAHSDFGQANGIKTTSEAHTGFYSLEVPANQTAVSFFFSDCFGYDPPDRPEQGALQVDNCRDCLPTFNLDYVENARSEKANTYVFDAWVKGFDRGSTIKVTVNSLSNPGGIDQYLSPAGPVIEGWQRVYGFFNINPDPQGIELNYENSQAESFFIDDVRIYPFDGNMKSFVYHPSSMKLMAELDANNHATLYEYDEQWNLIRVKKETENGIMTIQESRNNTRQVQ